MTKTRRNTCNYESNVQLMRRRDANEFRKDLTVVTVWYSGRAMRQAIVAVGVACVPLAGVAVAASAAGFDGTYRGDSTVTRGDESICGKARPVSYTVVNGQFSIVYDAAHHVGVNIQVQPDGSFSGSQAYLVGSRQAQVKASGRISGNVLEAQAEGQACARSYHLTKS
jgi:hypothetical protein